MGRFLIRGRGVVVTEGMDKLRCRDLELRQWVLRTMIGGPSCAVIEKPLHHSCPSKYASPWECTSSGGAGLITNKVGTQKHPSAENNPCNVAIHGAAFAI